MGDLGLAAALAGVIATVCAVLAVASWRALLRTGNRDIGFVVAGFAVMSVKHYAKAIVLGTEQGESQNVELLFSILDFVAVGLIAWPLLRGGMRAG